MRNYESNVLEAISLKSIGAQSEAKDGAQKGTWNGWQWRYLGLTVLGLAVLQTIAWVFEHISIVQTGEFAMMIIIGFIGPRIQARRLANTMAAVIASWVLSVVLQLIFFTPTLIKESLLPDLLILVIGIVIAYFFEKITTWSERKRSEMDAKRRVEEKVNANTEDKPKVRVHRKKKRRR